MTLRYSIGRIIALAVTMSMVTGSGVQAGSFGPDFSDVIPDARRTDWSQAGVPGGIRNRQTIGRVVKRSPDNPQTTTGSTSANSNQLIVAGAVDFEVGHGIVIEGAACVPWSNPCEAMPLATTVVAVNGNTLTLKADATNTVANVLVRHADGPAIQEAINECPVDQVVYLPEGVYKNVGVLSFGLRIINGVKDYTSNITLRGAGMGRTVLENCELAVGGTNDFRWDFPNTLITGSPTKALNGEPSVLNLGSTAFLDDLPNGGIGRICDVSIKKDLSTPVMGVGVEYLQRQKSRIIAKTATTVTVSPGLVFDLPASLEPRFNVAQLHAEFVGIEDLTFDGIMQSGGLGLVTLDQSYGCWLKNVELLNAKNRNFWISASLQIEMRGCRIENTIVDNSPNHSGLQMSRSSHCLLEDNIFANQFPLAQINDASSGNVVVHNYMYNGNFNINHGPHSSFNLYEGNLFVKALMQSDGFHGSSSDDTVFRNRFAGSHGVVLNRFARRYNIVGNILTLPGRAHLGTHTSNNFMPLPPSEWGNFDSYAFSFGNPNMGNGEWTGTASLSQNDPWADWPAYVNNTYNKFFAEGFQELDLDVGLSALLKGNFTFVNGGEIHPSEALSGGEVLPASLFRSAKPAYFGNLAWPPFDPTNGATTATNKIPAQLRYEGGTVPDPEPFAPVITIHPKSQVAVEGDFVQFTVEAAGFPLPSYQWRKNGVDISGATGTSYVIPASAVADSGKSFTVRVQNSVGSVTSNAGILTVIPKNEAPVVSLVKPAHGAQYPTNPVIGLEATASDPNGTITKVEFFNGSLSLGSVTAAPYTLVWNSVPGGTHSLTARATDNSGASVRSAVVQITVAGGSVGGGGGGSGEQIPNASGGFGQFDSVLNLATSTHMDIVLNLQTGGAATLRVKSRTGSDVAILKKAEAMNAGMQTVRWDGTNTEGSKVAAGTYLLMLDVGDGKHTKKIVVVK